jgi:hypothetical protein
MRVDNDFYKYARKFYHYRYEFYCRSENPGSLDGTSRSDRRLKIYDMYAHGSIIADQQHNDGRSQRLETFPFLIDYSLPLSQIKKKLKLFNQMIVDSYEIDDQVKPEFGRLVLRDYIRDGKGRIDYFKGNGEQPFSLWERYLKAYDLYKIYGSEQWQAISMDLGYYDPSKSNEKAASMKASRDVEAAKQLIEKSLSYTFPF